MLCLTGATDERWAALAIGDLPKLLVDHAHCEMKAATNALSLATRCPAVVPEAAVSLSRALVELAEEELAHYRAVLGELERRSLSLGKPDVDTYAAELRTRAMASCPGAPRAAFADRLLVGALIEARSCERFRLLADALAQRDDPLARFYDDLFACEARHYTLLADLAEGVSPAARSRLAELARIEGELAAGFGRVPTIHG